MISMRSAVSFPEQFQVNKEREQIIQCKQKSNFRITQTDVVVQFHKPIFAQAYIRTIQVDAF